MQTNHKRFFFNPSHFVQVAKALVTLPSHAPGKDLHLHPGLLGNQWESELNKVMGTLDVWADNMKSVYESLGIGRSDCMLSTEPPSRTKSRARKAQYRDMVEHRKIFTLHICDTTMRFTHPLEVMWTTAMKDFAWYLYGYHFNVLAPHDPPFLDLHFHSRESKQRFMSKIPKPYMVEGINIRLGERKAKSCCPPIERHQTGVAVTAAQ